MNALVSNLAAVGIEPETGTPAWPANSNRLCANETTVSRPSFLVASRDVIQGVAEFAYERPSARNSTGNELREGSVRLLDQVEREPASAC
ncbi:hypothetical protein [Hydrogenophaga sp. Root209]|uniref:hypothetical protein n=1 Tax=Hydrogenophaga sp. Root209 TaxID=1736490 RepID=UPI0012E3FA12|nr:hypothetical protein [Hydrogenophaga sp. Root209]